MFNVKLLKIQSASNGENNENGVRRSSALAYVEITWQCNGAGERAFLPRWRHTRKSGGVA